MTKDKKWKTLKKYKKNVIDWAKDKNIISYENYPKQMMKVMEELGELSSAILKGGHIAEVDSFGDVMVTLIILARQRDIDLVDSLRSAYQEIKNRKGKTVNGTFIKE